MLINPIGFNGSKGGGWKHLPTTCPSFSANKITGISDKRVARFSEYDEKLGMYEFDGANWTLKGSELSLGDVRVCDITALGTLESNGSVAVSYYTGSTTYIRKYHFNGASWGSQGNIKSLGLQTYNHVCALSASEIFRMEGSNDYCYKYKYSSSNWVQEGSSKDLGYVGHVGDCVALDGSTVVINTSGYLKTLQFNGSNWNQIGNQSPYLGSVGSGIGMTKIAENTIVVATQSTREITEWFWNGTDWELISTTDIDPALGTIRDVCSFLGNENQIVILMSNYLEVFER